MEGLASSSVEADASCGGDVEGVASSSVGAGAACSSIAAMRFKY